MKKNYLSRYQRLQPEVQKIVKDLSLRKHIPVDTIIEIVEAQFHLINEVMTFGTKFERDTFPTVNLPMFGKFGVKKYKLDLAKEEYEERVRQRIARGESPNAKLPKFLTEGRKKRKRPGQDT